MNQEKNIIDTSLSQSDEQQKAEQTIKAEVEKKLGCPLEGNVKIPLADGVVIEPDLYAEDAKIIGEIFAHMGTLKSGQKHKIAQDILKMLLLEKSKGISYRKLIVIIDDTIGAYLKGQSLLAESIRQFDVQVIKVKLSDDQYERILKAQKRQKMVNGGCD